MDQEKIKEQVTVRNIIRAISVILAVLFFVPSFMVSCSGSKVNISAVNAIGGRVNGEEVSSPNPGLIILLLIPVAIFAVWCLKTKLNAKYAAIITVAAAGLDFILWLVFRGRVEAIASENYCEFKVLGGFVFTILFLLILIAGTICILLGYLQTDISLIQARAIGSFQGLKDGISSVASNISGSGKWKCPNCGEMVSNNARFCGKCGTARPEQPEKLFCPNCGTILEEGVNFCPQCGTKREDITKAMVVSPAPQQSAVTPQQPEQNQFIQQSTEQPAVQQSESNSMGPAQNPQQVINNTNTEKKPLPKWIYGVIGGAAALIVILVVALSAKKTIDLNDYLTVTFDGYDTIGTARAELDGDALLQELLAKGKGLKNLNDIQLWNMMDQVDADPVLSNTSDLSNGDQVDLTWDVTDEAFEKLFKVKVKHHDETYTVSGLTELGTFDPFEGVEVTYAGIEPYGEVVLTNSPQMRSGLRYSFDKDTDLSNGDTVTLSVDAYNGDIKRYCAESFGEIPSSTSKTYTVEGLQGYVTSGEEIPEEIMAAMIKQGEDTYAAETADKWGTEDGSVLDSFTCVGYYFFNGKNRVAWGDQNFIELVFKSQIHNFAENSQGESYDSTTDGYWYISYGNLLKNPDGSVEVDLSHHVEPYKSFMVESGILVHFMSMNWTYPGYESLEELKNDVVIPNMADYNIEEMIDESVSPVSVAEPTAMTEAGNKMSGAGDQLLPDSETTIIEDADLEGMTAQELTYARNEIYARHGYVFDSDELNEYFGGKSWYKVNSSYDGKLTDIEQKNADTIRKYQEKNKLEYKPE